MSLKMNASWYIDVYGWMDRYLEGRERLSEREHKGLFNKSFHQWLDGNRGHVLNSILTVALYIVCPKRLLFRKWKRHWGFIYDQTLACVSIKLS